MPETLATIGDDQFSLVGRFCCQTMRPVFNDLVTEVQRSIGFFRSIDKKAEIGELLLTGNTMSLLPTIRSRCQTLSILQNRVSYDFTGRDELIRVIASMTKSKGAIVAVDAALHIVTTLQSLKKEAEAEVKQQYKRLSDQSADLDRSVQKRLDDEFLAQAATLYLSRRESLFSVVHSWFAQEYLRSHGVDLEYLPHPELYGCLGDDGPPPLNPGAARRSLDVTEGLLESLRFNVDEPLAIEDFCLQVCAKA